MLIQTVKIQTKLKPPVRKIGDFKFALGSKNVFKIIGERKGKEKVVLAEILFTG